MRRNTVVLGITLLLLAAFAWAGWANWQYRKQAAEKAAALSTEKAMLVADTGTLQYRSPLVNKPAPAFSLPDLKGGKVALAGLKGKPLLINFWATWCGPCKIETPWLIELHNQYGPQGLQIVGISTEGDQVTPADKAGWAKDRAAVEQFVTRMHMPYTVLMGGDSISKAYGGIDAMPTSFFVDRDGKVVAAQMGITSKDDIENNIKKALAE